MVTIERYNMDVKIANQLIDKINCWIINNMDTDERHSELQTIKKPSDSDFDAAMRVVNENANMIRSINRWAVNVKAPYQLEEPKIPRVRRK